MSAFTALLWKDTLTEARTWERLSTLVLFSAAVLVTLQFSLDADSPARPLVAAGFLWATIVFASLLELRRSLEAERRDGTLDALRASPLDPTLLYLSKVSSSLAVLAALEAVLVPLAAIFFGADLSGSLAAYGVCVAATAGLLAWGTLFAAVTSGTRTGEILLPVLLFPLVVPLTIAAVRLVSHALGGTETDSVATGLVLVGAFDVLSLGTGVLLFDYVLEE